MPRANRPQQHSPTALYFEIDSDAPAQDPALLGETMQMIHSLKFP